MRKLLTSTLISIRLMVILRDTISTTQSIANAMAAVVDYWDGSADACTMKYGCHNSVEVIQLLYPDVSRKLDQARSFIIENWEGIVRSRIKIDEVHIFLSGLKDFFRSLRGFENEFCRHDSKAFDTFDDAWIARKYFVMMLNKSNEYNSIFGAFESVGNQRPHQARPFNGMARAFKAYFEGVTDAELEDLVVNHKYFDKAVLWKGLRSEAVIFAESFGLSASIMNHCFIIPGKHFEHRNIGLKQDNPHRPYNEYGIYSKIQLYEHCKL